MNEQTESKFEYVGFWARVGATLIDTIIILMISAPLMYMFYGDSYLYSDDFVLGFVDVIVNYIFPLVAVLIFWTYKSATPGKMAIKAIIVDADTGKRPTTKQYIIRYFGYFGYFISILPLCLGLMWVGWDSKKQGWHDKLAKTVVIRPQNRRVESVKFNL
ncbi:RDD family protein [Photobacterium frigidiphilum]|uniref:RDD family protein n=1 Tax=Photobacterium frigidiphilum TaxID=264736 RepID=A0A2T3J976_9GAMM|nr:RDD family protein [Photobacterium frigidiphilum]PSU45357.1 RDD family protein [Photobacterium frigidiphilum]